MQRRRFTIDHESSTVEQLLSEVSVPAEFGNHYNISSRHLTENPESRLNSSYSCSLSGAIFGFTPIGLLSG